MAFYNKYVLQFFFCMLIFLLHNSLSFSQQNIEIFYPTTLPPSLPPGGVPVPAAGTPPVLSPSTPSGRRGRTSRKTIVMAVGGTAASTIVVVAVLFSLWTVYGQKKRNEGGDSNNNGKKVHVNPYAPRPRTTPVTGAVAGFGAGGLQPVAQAGFTRFDGNVKGLIVDEDGLDVLYWRKLEGSSQRKSGPFHKEIFSSSNKPPSGRKSYSRMKSSNTSPSIKQVHPKDDHKAKLLDSKLPSSSDPAKLQNLGEDHTPPAPAPAPAVQVLASVPAPPPPPPRKVAPPPPPPPGGVKKGPPPPPPPRGGSAGSRPPAAPKKTPSGRVVEVEEEKNDQVKMKPLHWEKVNVVNRDHSMVWDKLDRGSFQYNGDMMEALFGTVAARKSVDEGNSSGANKTASNPAAKITIIDPRRSQNIAIVIRSLGISRQELIDGLSEGNGLSIEILEKLTRIAPTTDEKNQILAFDGEVDSLADGESFLYFVLKALPSAFTRVNAMLFRYTYGSEIQHLKDLLQTLDSACTELRSRGVFLKLLEAILKAGNRLNAGTARGEAKAFNLTALRKLSDYKSSDGKTTLLHFVVHEVVRNEGRRCVMNRNNSINRSNSQKNASSVPNMTRTNSKEDQEKEFLKLGLPVVGGLSSEFLNVKKAASIDNDILSSIIPSLETRIAETRQLVSQCRGDRDGAEFVKEMQEFLEAAAEEVNTVKEEQSRVIAFIRKTTQYYQSGGFKEKHPLQMFRTVKDFLAMVDKACVDITRSLQQKKAVPVPTGAGTGTGTGAGPSSPTSPPTPDALRTRVTFPRLPEHFLSGKSLGSDSDDD